MDACIPAINPSSSSGPNPNQGLQGALPREGVADLRWIACAVGLTIVLAVPFFLVEVPPVLDYPNHLGRYFVLAHPDDPFLSQIYKPHWRLLPNLGMDVLGAGLLQLTSVHVGGRILLALSLFAPVIGVIVYSRVAFRRFSYWPLASGLIAYNGIFFLGFMNFLLSLGLAFIGAAYWMVQRRRGDWSTPLVGAVAAALIYFCHIFGVILFAILITAQEMSRLLAARRSGTLTVIATAKAFGLLAFVVVPTILLYLVGPLSGGAAAPGAWLGDRKFWTAFTPFMTTNVDLTLWTGLAVVSLIALCWRNATLAPGSLLAMLALAVLFIAAPTSIKGGSFVDVRMPLMMAMLLFAGVQPRFNAAEAVVAGWAVAALIIVRTGYVSATRIEHRRDLADLHTAIAPMPPLSRVLLARGISGVKSQPGEVSSRVLPGMYRLDGHWPALIAIERRAFWPLMFADSNQQPLEIKSPYDRLAQPLAEPVVWSNLNLDRYPDSLVADAHYLPDWRHHFDYVLLIDPPPVLIVPHDLTPVVNTGFAVLYKIQTSPL